MVDNTFQRGNDALQTGDVLVVVHDFDARSSDELTLRKGDRVQLVELDDGFSDGWYLGRHLGKETTGLFPGVYTAKLPPHLTNIRPPTTVRSPFIAPEPISKSTVSNLPEMPAGLRTSSSQEILKPYQHAPTSPVPEKPLASSNQYSQIQSLQYDPPRASIPPSHGSQIPLVPRSIGQTLDDAHKNDDSPVMNETLSVIDEHITDLSTPRQSLSNPQQFPEDSASEYSNSQIENSSFVAGPETDDEENGRLNADLVSKWDHKQTANHLRDLGVDPKHCDIFEEQEITGDVLLEMDQSFLSMKEYDFGVMGRRLKTWHKIREFQNQVRGGTTSRAGKASESGSMDSVPQNQNRILSGATILPRIPSLSEKPGLSLRHSLHGHSDGEAGIPRPLQTQHFGYNISRTSLSSSSPSTPWRASVIAESPSRPSAALVREMSHSRRHSSIDFGKLPDLEMPASSMITGKASHHKQKSFDRNWSMSAVTPGGTNITTPSLRLSTIRKQESLEQPSGSPLLSATPNLDLDRGYFSGNEIDNRKARNVLRKRESMGSTTHSRQSSFFDESRKASAALKRQSRMSSLDSSRDQNAGVTSPAARAYHSKSYKGRFRSASAQSPSMPISPRVGSTSIINLEDDHSPTVSSPRKISSPSGPMGVAFGKISLPNQARKIMGLRTASEGVTGANTKIDNELTNSTTGTSSTLKDSPIASPEGSSTPSVASRSLEVDNTDASSKNTDPMGSKVSTAASNRARAQSKPKKFVYTGGLLKISPKEARKTCDHHGWMKKKSSSLMTTWKPRLFVLHGRRLSYYYSEDDTEERGFIDIAGHKVLVANSDPLITLHATITRAASSTSPSSSSTPGKTSPVTARSPGNNSSSLFYFKLIPPRAGMSRTIQFSKPTVHYFQVDTIMQGRKWMGEIMKATIEHDLSTFETTNKQKTISLQKARERKERPPALMNSEALNEAASENNSTSESGLNIQGVNLEQPDVNGKSEDFLGGVTNIGN